MLTDWEKRLVPLFDIPCLPLKLLLSKQNAGLSLIIAIQSERIVLVIIANSLAFERLWWLLNDLDLWGRWRQRHPEDKDDWNDEKSNDAPKDQLVLKASLFDQVHQAIRLGKVSLHPVQVLQSLVLQFVRLRAQIELNVLRHLFTLDSDRLRLFELVSVVEEDALVLWAQLDIVFSSILWETKRHREVLEEWWDIASCVLTIELLPPSKFFLSASR